jgi:hypothetical protein
MIDPKELRVGNWLQYKNTPFEVEEIVIGGINMYQEGYSVYGFGECDTIPLIPEILEKCGFMDIPFQRGMAFINLDSSPYDNRVLEYSKSTNNIYIVCSQGGEGEEINTTKMLTQVKYLHQLQNLYFALTGSELKIVL